MTAASKKANEQPVDNSSEQQRLAQPSRRRFIQDDQVSEMEVLPSPLPYTKRVTTRESAYVAQDIYKNPFPTAIQRKDSSLRADQSTPELLSLEHESTYVRSATKKSQLLPIEKE